MVESLDRSPNFRLCDCRRPHLTSEQCDCCRPRSRKCLDSGLLSELLPQHWSISAVPRESQYSDPLKGREKRPLETRFSMSLTKWLSLVLRIHSLPLAFTPWIKYSCGLSPGPYHEPETSAKASEKVIMAFRACAPEPLGPQIHQQQLPFGRGKKQFQCRS